MGLQGGSVLGRQSGKGAAGTHKETSAMARPARRIVAAGLPRPLIEVKGGIASSPDRAAAVLGQGFATSGAAPRQPPCTLYW
jgi:hypothetical protein